VLLAILFVAGCHRDKCTPFCERTAKAIGCVKLDACKTQCKQLHESPVCGAEFKVFEACMLQQSPDKWVCDPDDTPALKDGVCVPERLKVTDCLSSAPPPPPPKTP
jgi:hypothetical protein